LITHNNQLEERTPVLNISRYTHFTVCIRVTR
jgi:hypothetical protein